MRREQRLRTRKDFAAAYRTTRVQSNHLLVVRVNPNGRELSRFGFVAGKVVGGAVVRNRIKRRLREAARHLEIQPGFDIVIAARKAAVDASFQALERALATLLAREGIICAAPGSGS